MFAFPKSVSFASESLCRDRFKVPTLIMASTLTDGLDVSHESDLGDGKVRVSDSKTTSAFNEPRNEHSTDVADVLTRATHFRRPSYKTNPER